MCVRDSRVCFNIQGLPLAPRPIIKPSAPESQSDFLAEEIQTISPLTITGIPTPSLIFLISDHKAFPLKNWHLVLA